MKCEVFGIPMVCLILPCWDSIAIFGTISSHCSAVQYSVVQCSVVQRSVVQSSAVQSSVVQSSIMQCPEVECENKPVPQLIKIAS